jgi:mRNA-degrading endonuclease RelE of RelBE toxin-antitoxin system
LGVAWVPRALRDLDALDPTIRARVLEAIERLATTGQGDVKRLKGADREFRLRAGDWRVRFCVSGGEMRILAVAHRREAYR